MDINNEFQELFDDIESDTEEALFGEQDGMFDFLNETDMLESFLDSLSVNMDAFENGEDIIPERITDFEDGTDIDTFIFNEIDDDGIIIETDSIFDELISSDIFQTDENL